MDEKKVTSAPEQSGDRDQALFASIRREKQRKKRRRIIVTVSIVVVLALAIFFGVRAAKKKVREAVGSMKAPTVSEAIVTTGSISTTISGSGMLTDADTQQIVLPKGVKLEKILAERGLVGPGESLYSPKNIILMHHLMASLKAHTLFKRDQQYVVQDGEIVIVDEFTGRLMYGRRYNEGLHQAIDAAGAKVFTRPSKLRKACAFSTKIRRWRRLPSRTTSACTRSSPA